MKRVEILLAIAVGCLIFMGYALADQYHPASEVSPGDFRGTSTDSYKFPGRLYFSSGGSILGSPTGLVFLDSANKQRIFIGGPTGLSSLKGTIYFSLGASGSSFYFMNASSIPLLTLSDAGNLWVKGNLLVDSTSESQFRSSQTYLYIQPVTDSDTSGYVRLGAYDMTGTTGARDLALAPAGGNVGIGTTNPGTNRLKVAGNTEITSNLSVGGKTNIFVPVVPWKVIDCDYSTPNVDCANKGNAQNQVFDFNVDTSYSAVMLGIRPDYYSDVLYVAFYTGTGGTGIKIGEIDIPNAFCTNGAQYFNGVKHAIVTLPTTVKSWAVTKSGGCGGGRLYTDNIIIMGYFR